jgi:hypothetical protein
MTLVPLPRINNLEGRTGYERDKVPIVSRKETKRAFDEACAEACRAVVLDPTIAASAQPQPRIGRYSTFRADEKRDLAADCEGTCQGGAALSSMKQT